MDRRSVEYIRMEKERRALTFINSIEQEQDKDKKIKLFVAMMTYYDATNALNLQLFCMDLLQDKSIYSRDSKLENKIIELEDIKKSTYEKM